MHSNQFINGFKVVRRAGKRLVSAAACAVQEVAKWEVEYHEGQTTVAPPDARSRGYGIAIFASLDNAKQWATRWARESGFHLEIWTAEGEQLDGAKASKIDGSYWSAWADTSGGSGNRTVFLTSEWPNGTVLCSQIHLLKRLETINEPG